MSAKRDVIVEQVVEAGDIKKTFLSRAHTLTLSLNLQTVYLSSVPVWT